MRSSGLFRELAAFTFGHPPSTKMSYPCIRYELAGYDVKHANDSKYLKRDRYTVTIIDKDPDSKIPDKLLAMPYCGFDRAYTQDNLNHWVFTLYY